jgi:2,3-bisphosphoglycerate-dependent phosphoglycerate mutase
VLGKLVLLRHGQSTWNELNLFTGWHDVPLSAQGLEEAAAAGTVMAEAGLSFDVAHTSLLTRAVMTCHLALNGMGQVWLPVQRHWKWNERHYGALQGLDKKATTEQHGEAQTKVWRRSFDVPPPPVDSSSPEHPALLIRRYCPPLNASKMWWSALSPISMRLWSPNFGLG